MAEQIVTESGARLAFGLSRLGGNPRWECLDCGVYIVVWDDREELELHALTSPIVLN